MKRARSGRCWTVRLVPYGRPAQGVCVIDCTAAVCRSRVPASVRHRDPARARAAAWHHMRAHAEEWDVAAGAVCRCRSTKCAWHSQAIGCGGDLVLVVVPGLGNRVWTVAEVCSACAQAVPGGRILKHSSGIAAGAASAAAAVRRDPCAVCVQEATLLFSRVREDAAAEKTALTAGAELQPVHVAWLEPALRYLSTTGGGRTSQGRLLAFLVLLRPSGFRGIRLMAADFSVQHTGLTETAVEDLAETGWLRRIGGGSASCTVSREAVWAASDAERGRTDVPLLPAHEHLALHDWVCRLIGHALLRGQPAEVRLAAVCLTARSALRSRADVGLRPLTRICAFGSPEAGVAALNALRATGWVDKLHVNSGWKQPATYHLGQAASLFLAPPGTPPPALVAVPAAESCFAVASWVHAFEDRHRHPPALRDVLAFHAGQDPAHSWNGSQLKATAGGLQREAWLEVGDGTEQLVRPGRQYWRHLNASKAKARKRHALSPRQEDPGARSADPPARTQRPVDISPHGHGPDLPLRPVRSSKPSSPSTPSPSAVPPGIWLLPGARAVLASDRP